MRTLVLLSLLGATCLGAQPGPASVDALTPADVAKAISAVKQNFVQPDALSETEMSRATLQGLLDRLAPEVSLVTGSAAAEPAMPFYSEAYEGRTGYLRIGELSAANIAKAAAALKDWSAKGLGAVVLDLRGTPPGSGFDQAAALAELFCAKGTEMFTLAAGSNGKDSAVPPTHTFSAQADAVFTGVLVVLVDADTAEAPEAAAASLRKCAKALVVGDKTAGRACEYSDVPLDGAVLRVAVARVMLPDGKELGEEGLRPDIDVGLGAASKSEVMQKASAQGVGSVVEESERPHLNEAALVSGSNPEVDELEAEQSGQKPQEPLLDRQLQRALDLVTSISIYQAKDGAK